VVQRFTAFFSGGDSNHQVVFYLALPDEFIHVFGAQAGFDGAVFNDGFP
jgi:hypothetical protein